MARPANPENRYSLTCKVTGKQSKTNPKQFSSLMNRYGISATELDNSYVCREGRKVVESEKLTPEQAVEKYGIHINVANSLKCTVKSKPVQPVQPEQVEGTVAVETAEAEVVNSETAEPVATETVEAEAVTA